MLPSLIVISPGLALGKLHKSTLSNISSPFSVITHDSPSIRIFVFLPTLEIVIISSVKPSTVRLPNAISDVKESTAGVSGDQAQE